jgi:hypothetical protein
MFYDETLQFRMIAYRGEKKSTSVFQNQIVNFVLNQKRSLQIERNLKFCRRSDETWTCLEERQTHNTDIDFLVRVILHVLIVF